jgi:hypothetical protein
VLSGTHGQDRKVGPLFLDDPDAMGGPVHVEHLERDPESIELIA